MEKKNCSKNFLYVTKAPAISGPPWLLTRSATVPDDILSLSAKPNSDLELLIRTVESYVTNPDFE